jgi:N-formylglutamate deformylase
MACFLCFLNLRRKIMQDRFFEFSIDADRGPLLATAIHDGHQVREELDQLFNLSANERLREEDPHTGTIARAFPNYLIGSRSRFEVDLNRSKEKAVYQQPEDAWGLQVWKEPLSPEMVSRSLDYYKNFYEAAGEQVQQIIDKHGYAIIYDIHSYNHRREGADKAAASPEGNPDIDILTSGIHMDTWRPVLDKLKQVLSDHPFPGGKLDVREEVRFTGDKSHFMQWILNRFQDKVLVPSIEFKKIYMDEWTNELYHDKLDHLIKALKQTVPAVIHEAEVNQKIPASL